MSNSVWRARPASSHYREIHQAQALVAWAIFCLRKAHIPQVSVEGVQPQILGDDFTGQRLVCSANACALRRAVSASGWRLQIRCGRRNPSARVSLLVHSDASRRTDLALRATRRKAGDVQENTSPIEIPRRRAPSRIPLGHRL